MLWRLCLLLDLAADFLGPGGGQQLGHPVVGAVGQAREHIAHILVRIEAVQAAVGDERVKHRRLPTAFLAADKQPVLFADRCGTNGVFDEIGVQLHPSVTQEDAKPWPRSGQIADGEAEGKRSAQHLLSGIGAGW